jgi:hypothetical protein
LPKNNCAHQWRRKACWGRRKPGGNTRALMMIEEKKEEKGFPSIMMTNFVCCWSAVCCYNHPKYVSPILSPLQLMLIVSFPT